MFSRFVIGQINTINTSREGGRGSQEWERKREKRRTDVPFAAHPGRNGRHGEGRPLSGAGAGFGALRRAREAFSAATSGQILWPFLVVVLASAVDGGSGGVEAELPRHERGNEAEQHKRQQGGTEEEKARWKGHWIGLGEDMREGTQGESSHLFLVCARFRTRRSSWAARPPPSPPSRQPRIAFLTLTFRANAFSHSLPSPLSRQGQKRWWRAPPWFEEADADPAAASEEGFPNPHRREYQWLNLYKLSSWIRQGRIDRSLSHEDSGLWGGGQENQGRVKLLGAGHEIRTRSPSRSAAVRAGQGVHREAGRAGADGAHNKLGLKARKPGTFDTLPFPARPPPKLRHLFEYVGRLGQ